jgi:hypothetical protein
MFLVQLFESKKTKNHFQLFESIVLEFQLAYGFYRVEYVQPIKFSLCDIQINSL